MSAPEPLNIGDILDLRAYERVRDDFRRRIIEHKARRRVALGPVMTLVFESINTVRFKVQEMARAERILSDEGIQTELDVYNRLLPAPGELSATMFIELTSDEQLREWLPRLVGIEHAIGFELASVNDPAGGHFAPASLVQAVPESEHEAALTRNEVTAAVHYLRFPFSAEQVELFASAAVTLVAGHADYAARTDVGPETKAELWGDLLGTTPSIELP